MRKYLFLFLFFPLLLGGCQTVKNAALGTTGALYSIGKGLLDDAYSTYRTIEKADKWFREHYW